MMRIIIWWTDTKQNNNKTTKILLVENCPKCFGEEAEQSSLKWIAWHLRVSRSLWFQHIREGQSCPEQLPWLWRTPWPSVTRSGHLAVVLLREGVVWVGLGPTWALLCQGNGLLKCPLVYLLFPELKHPSSQADAKPVWMLVKHFSTLLVSDYENCRFYYLQEYLPDWTLKSGLFWLCLWDPYMGVCLACQSWLE